MIQNKKQNILSADPNLTASVCGHASSSAKSAGELQTNALSLEQCGFNDILGNTKIRIYCHKLQVKNSEMRVIGVPIVLLV